MPVNAGYLYNVNGIIQVHECTQNTKKRKKTRIDGASRTVVVLAVT